MIVTRTCVTLLLLCVLVCGDSRLTPSDEAALAALSQLNDDVLLWEAAEPLGQAAAHPEFCELVEYGTGWGRHTFCRLHPAHLDQCRFVSYGVSHDWSFESSLSSLGCQGLSLDPSVSLPPELVPGVLFVPIAANVLNISNAERVENWTYLGIPHMLGWYGHHLAALKLDCEGCEYSVAADVEEDVHSFFSRFSQLNVEFHLPRHFMRTPQHAVMLGRLVLLLRENGFRFQHHDGAGCGTKREDEGFEELFLGTNWGRHDSDGRLHEKDARGRRGRREGREKAVILRGSCLSLLFSKAPQAAAALRL